MRLVVSILSSSMIAMGVLVVACEKSTPVESQVPYGGERVLIGDQYVGDWRMYVWQSGKVVTGSDIQLELGVNTPGTQYDKKATSIRAWIGLTADQIKTSAKLVGDGYSFHGLLRVPEAVEPGSKLWLAAEVDGVLSEPTSFEMKR